jgi:hypothetical protein
MSVLGEAYRRRGMSRTAPIVESFWTPSGLARFFLTQVNPGYALSAPSG